MERYTNGFPDSLKIQRRLSIHTDVVDDDDDLLDSPARSLLYFCPYGSALSYFHFHFRLLKVLDAARENSLSCEPTNSFFIYKLQLHQEGRQNDAKGEETERFYGAVTLERRSDYGLNNLVHLRKLEKLRFSYRRSVSCNVPTPILAFPRSLKKLTLSDCRFPWEHTTIVGSLPNLEVLKLLWYGFCGREWQPVLGEFSQLKYLAIDTTDLECWLADSTNFPRLEHLRLENCSRLERIPSDIGEILTLKLIELRNCSSSAVDSAKEILEEQQNQGNESLQVRFYS
ncbi:putative late blight resistance proteinR1B-12 [Sesamum angolense]|uniref:Late blight resistance proteinR1B-12 n=1 Tax=Sesamum angolense TaxID=2727404 RepID=A0AAE1WLT4_9LAMI|nr:putative late blight resistance proteinR1B-12 [Sesamum angolense]